MKTKTAMHTLELALTSKQRKLWSGLTTPFKIQEFLDSIEYSAEERYRSPLNVIRDRKAHCFDGGIFAAAALRRLGFPPLLVYLTAKRDDEHLLAVYKKFGHWGAVSKSNYAGLRFREPVYRTMRELVMSYFEPFFNIYGEKSMRGYTVPPQDLTSFDRIHWLTRDEAIDEISERLDHYKVVPVLNRRQAANLSPVDKRSYKANLMGANRAGLYDPDSTGK